MSFSIRVAALLAAAFFLVGCQTTRPTPEQISAEQDAKCQSFGYQKGSTGYASCRQSLYMEEQRQREQTLAYLERLQANRPPPMQIDVSPDRPSIHCTSTVNSGVAQTDCR